MESLCFPKQELTRKWDKAETKTFRDHPSQSVRCILTFVGPWESELCRAHHALGHFSSPSAAAWTDTPCFRTGSSHQGVQHF